MWKSLYEFCTERDEPTLLAQWHPARNGDLTPKDVSPGSERKVWWRCERGHEWQACVYARCRGDGCPVCAGKTVVAGENDLASRFPDLAAQWHPRLNGDLPPDGVTAYSNRRVFWLCPQGHTYTAAVAARTRQGCGCPYCAGQRVKSGENDLASRYPEVAARWHPTRNGKLTPAQVMPHTHKRCWWLCEKGHEWQAAPFALVQGNSCPYCAGKRVIPGETDLETLNPELAGEWHPTKNAPLTPRDIMPGSMKRVWYWNDYICFQRV